MTSEWVYDLRGKEVVFTGKFESFNEVELTKIAERLGASRVKEWVNKSSTDVLVRGWSPHWKYGRYGSKEKQVAEMLRAGHHIQIIDTEGFFGLRSHYPAPALKPNVPDAPARADAAEGGVVGAPYRAGAFAGPLQGDGEHYRDPDIMERGLKAHSATQDKLAELIGLHGLTPLSPFDKACNFDLAWEGEDGSVGVAEVKSITEGNEAFQVRHGLGQVLDYGHRLRGRGFRPKLFLVLEAKPKDAAHWKPLCADHDVTLVFGPHFAGIP
ncbi:BRCT domain-containing protein [Arthrobacter sp. NPDC093125]|uniref:BRCT domain-containing protein n=1 Tax=Arthrobacter sp. NPDC093125 TaxID=3363944 RepID=UPI0038038EA7